MTDHRFASPPNALQPAHADAQQPPTEYGPGYQPRQLVLLGAGHAHLLTLNLLAKQPLVGVRITLVSPYANLLATRMLPGLVAGQHTQEACTIPLEPLVRHSGVRWLNRSVRALDANNRIVELDDGSQLQYDWLSINTGPIQNRAALEQVMPGAREFGLFLRPVESFAAIWPQVSAMADSRALRITVIGGGAAGVEIALAMRRRLPNCAITIACAEALVPNLPPSARQRLLQTLRRRRITVIYERVTGIQATTVQLHSGALLACDVPLIATGAQAAPWLCASDLACDEQGFVQVDALHRSTSHPEIFATGDVCQRIDRPLPRNAVSARRVGPTLAFNLAAVAQGSPAKPHQPPTTALTLIDCADGTGVAVWGRHSAQGRWVCWLKNWIDRRFVARFARAA